jgi:glycosyltransferase involved in cell wall biosynthesis
VLVNSETTKADVMHYAGVDGGKITVIPLGPGTDIKRRDPDSVSGSEVQDIPYPRFLFALGTLEPRKNLPLVFHAMAELRDQGKLGDLGLAVAGGRGWKEAGIFTELERLKIDDRVTFLGYVPDERLSTLFARCEAFVFPTLIEGFGMPILEAMLAGAPVLTSGRGAMLEVGGDAVALFDPTSSEDLATCIYREVIQRREPREAWAERGSERAKLFTWQGAAERTMTILREAVGE